MDRYAKKVYEFVLSQPDHSFIYQMYPDQVPGGINRFQDFKLACQWLAEKGYAVVKSPGMVALTHAGIHKRELELINIRNKILTRFIPGFICGVLVTVAEEVLVRYILSLLGI